MIHSLLELDISAFRWCNRYHTKPAVIRFYRYISRTGDGYFYALLAAAIYLFEHTLGKSLVICGLFAFFLEIPAFIALKHLIKRDRPFVGLVDAKTSIQPSDKFSLPSGHSAAAFVMATLISNFYPEFSLFAYLWASLIGVSRVMLGVHYPTDIIAGAVLGTVCSLVSMLALASLLVLAS